MSPGPPRPLRASCGRCGNLIASDRRQSCGIVGATPKSLMESSMNKSAVAVLLATVSAPVVAVSTQSPPITIVLTGQSMIRSDLQATKPAALPAMKGLLNGDVIFTNLEAAIAEP